jgi:hypothetical protein
MASSASTSSCRPATSCACSTNSIRCSRARSRWARPTMSICSAARLTNWWPSARARPPTSSPRPVRAGSSCSRTSTGRWPQVRELLATVGLASMQPLAAAERLAIDPRATLFVLLQDRSIRVSWKTEVREPLARILQGQAVPAAAQALRRDPQAGAAQPGVRRLHMHAGDGNVHTNIPVNSDDYGMLKEAEAAVARIMALARSLDGVISGEHGIGITKLEFLTEDEIRRVPRLQAAHRPRGPLQQGQAAGRWRPAQRLHAQLRADGGRVADPAGSPTSARSPIRSRTACAAASASRCAPRMCRAPTCSTARATRSWPPRCWSRPSCTRSRPGAACRSSTGTSFPTSPTTAPCATSARSPCPVDIDFGDVSMNMRNLLRKMGKKKFNPAMRRRCSS